MEINVKFTTDEAEILFDAISALKGDIGKMCGSQDDIDAAYEKVHRLELRLRDILKGAIAKAMA